MSQTLHVDLCVACCCRRRTLFFDALFGSRPPLTRSGGLRLIARRA